VITAFSTGCSAARLWRSAAAAAALLGAVLACGPATNESGPAPVDDASDAGAEPADPPRAQRDLLEALREAAERTPPPADLGGRAWRDESEGTQRARVRTPGRFVFHFEVGDAGVATGGAVFFQVSPFWGWDTPQTEAVDAPGYTTVEASSDDVTLDARAIDQQLLLIENVGRPLRAGETLRIAYGDGPAGATADEYAERNSRFWFAVDGDGDGHRGPYLADSPGVDVGPGPPARLVITLPTVARPGEALRLTVAVLDAYGNAGPDFSGDVRFEDPPDGLALPEAIPLRASDGARATVEVVAREEGTYRLTAVAGEGIAGRSNPLVVAEAGPRVLWADLHGHSASSDGTGRVDDYFTYARDVAALDVAVLTDHDHWGVLPLDANPALWDEITREVERFHEPGRFVTVLGYEWTSWIHGHRHVLYFGDTGEIHSSVARETESPTQLWAALAGQPALTFAHHSAGGPVPTNWEIPPDPTFEPVTEIVSIHGSSEALDSPMPIYNPLPGNFVRDALGRGYTLGFVGSGDGHDGHPGLARINAPTGGLAAILAEDLTREAVLEAFRERRVYATNGPRILLRTAFGEHGMGSVVAVPDGATRTEKIFVHVVAATPLQRVDLVRSGGVVDSVSVDGLLEVMLQREVADVAPGEYLYVRAVQEDTGAAWSSPIYFR